MDKPAKGGEGILLLLQQRRAGEPEIAGVRQDTPHLHGQLAVSAILAGLATVALVHQHENIRVRVSCRVATRGRVEFVDNGGDQRRLVADQLEQMRAAGRPDRLHLARPEGVFDLPVEVVTVGDDHDTRIGDVLVERQSAAQHDHGQRLAGPLGVPDDTAPTATVRVKLLDPFHSMPDTEELLVAGDLAHPAVKDREAPHQIEQALGPTQRKDGAVLRRGSASALGREIIEI